MTDTDDIPTEVEYEEYVKAHPIIPLPCGCSVIFGDGDVVEYRSPGCDEGERLNEPLRDLRRAWWNGRQKRRHIAEGPEWDALNVAIAAFNIHFDMQVAAAKTAARAKYEAAFRALCSEDPRERAYARVSQAGAAILRAFRERRRELS